MAQLSNPGKKIGLTFPSPTLTPSRLRAIPLELTRSLLNCIVIRGRYRLASIISRVFMPREKLALRHRYGDTMVFDFSNPHEVSMYFDFFAPDLSQIILRYLRPGDCFIDCGANIGYFSCIATSLVGEGGQVISIDANPYCIERTRESKMIGQYGNMNIVMCAIGDHEGEIEFKVLFRFEWVEGLTAL